MKKKIVLLLSLMFLFHTTIWAAESRYVDIMKEDTVIAQLDKETFRYEKDPYRNEQLISVWIKNVFPTGNYSLNHYFFRMNNRELMLMNTVNVNANGQITYETENAYNPNAWSTISPESFSEACYTTAMKYSQDNDKTLQAEYKKRMIKPADNNRRGIPIVTDIFNVLSNNT